MRSSVVILFIIIACGCRSKPIPQMLLPEDYYFPETKLEIGKTFVYLNEKTGDTTYLDLFHSEVNGKTFLVERSYDKNSVSDSVILTGRRVVAHYINPLDTGQLWEANQISHTIISDTAGGLKEISEIHWENGLRYAFVRSTNKIGKDTLVQWNGRSYHSIVTTTLIETNSNFLRTPDGEYNPKMEVINYMCKGIGSVKRVILCKWYAHPIISNLVEIREMRKK